MAVGWQNQYDKRAYLASRLQNLRKPTATKGLKKVEAHGSIYAGSSDEELRDQVAEWRLNLAEKKTTLEEIVEPAIALARETARRATDLFPYDEQVLAALALTTGHVAEQATGEGKTLTTTLPAIFFALAGNGVHVATVNSYLAKRDFEFARPIFEFLNLSIAFLDPDKSPEEKRAIYRHDVVYGTGYDFGFDYLRDQLAMMEKKTASATDRLCDALTDSQGETALKMHRGLAYAIVDEIDSVLIDEASSPLVISQSLRASDFSSTPYLRARELAASLQEGDDFRILGDKRCVLTRAGNARTHSAKKIPWNTLRRPWKNYILNALVAEHLFQLDIQYVVKDDAVIIIDEFTGRAHAERSWREGLHQAVETKEGITVKPESKSAASITRQRFFSRYQKSCGLTGTAAESAGEFWHFFKLPVAQIPLHKPCVRRIYPERVFKDRANLYDAVVESVTNCLRRGQPVLVGTRTIRVSEAISEKLEAINIVHELLTAKQDEEENRIITEAGIPGSVVIATNMAGRGTHIDLNENAVKAGGLHVIAIERNDSERIDRQLIGRCARQGEPGSSQSFVSAEDDLLSEYAPSLAKEIKASADSASGEVSQRFSKKIDRIQRKVELLKYEQRLALSERDLWNDQTRSSLS